MLSAHVNTTRSNSASGSSRRFHPTTNARRAIMKTRSTIACRTRSTPAVPTDEMGNSSRGKYTLVTRLALSTTLRAPRPSAVENRFHASRPENR
jgi:hypothetical protein